jgi:hypothetical protein
MTVIERDPDENPPGSPIPPSPFRVRCVRCGTLYVGECHVCLRQQHRDGRVHVCAEGQ